MNPRALVRRVAAIGGDELRFRIACETRKAAGRVRFAVAPPAWHRADLAHLLDPSAGALVTEARNASLAGDDLAAHRALGQHFAARSGRWPVAAAQRTTLSQLIREQFPSAAIDARDRAELVVKGRYDLLGYRDLALGDPPDWHADAVHGRRAPRGYWTGVPFLNPASGDHKVIWEVNRHQHFLLLGAAFWLTGCERYRDTFVAHLEDWLRANPPLDGINWASMLELAFRALSWTWAVEFFCQGAEADDTPWLVDLLVALDRQLIHIEQNLSAYFSPNTHFSGEALALYAVSRAFPELTGSRARETRGRAILHGEARAQVREDGGHAELSSHYHRYSTDFYLLAHLVGRRTQDEDARFEAPLRAQAAYLRTIADDHGRLPHTGDEDGGQLFRFGGAVSSDASPTLSAAANALGDADLAVAPATPDACWILGDAPGSVPARPAAWHSRVLDRTGYVVFRREDRGAYLLFDAGPHGFLNGGHAHADALSVVLTIGDDPLLVDPGTPTYTMDAAARDRFRRPDMHNTVTVDGRPFALPSGPFHWLNHADARLLAARIGGVGEFAAGMHSGYGFPIVRVVTVVGDAGWLIVDHVRLPRRARIDTHWLVHPAWSAAVTATGFSLTHLSGTRLALATTASQRSVETSPWSPDYGRIAEGTALHAAEVAEGPIALASYVPARLTGSGAPALTAMAPAPGRPGWTLFPFAIAAGDDIRVEVAIPDAPETRPHWEDWPQPCIQERRAVCVE
jgi:hypothetical protein